MYVKKTRQNQTNHISNHLDILAPTKLNAQGSAVQVCLSALQFGQPKRPPRRFDRYSPSLREPHEPHNPRATHFHIPTPLTVWFPRLSYKGLWPSSCCRRSRNVCHAYHPCYWQNLLQNHHRHPQEPHVVKNAASAEANQLYTDRSTSNKICKDLKDILNPIDSDPLCMESHPPWIYHLPRFQPDCVQVTLAPSSEAQMHI